MYATRDKKVKTDKRDARTLSEACRLGAYCAAHRTSELQRRIRAQISVREAPVRTRSRRISLIGQATGQRPNSAIRSQKEMRLPNSRLVVRYSTQFYKFVEPGENLVRPDYAVITSWSDFKSGRDALLEWVLVQHT